MFNVILPTYNEARNIGPLLQMLRKTFVGMGKRFLLVVVDDNSEDGTSQVVRELDMEEVVVLDRPSKLGLGSAYADGLKCCIYPYTILMDTDLQHDAYAIPRMYDVLVEEGCEIVSGTRYGKGGMVSGWEWKRKMMSVTANRIGRWVVGLNVSDVTGSFRMYRTEVLRKVIKEVGCRGFGFQMEMIARAERMGSRIGECGIVFHSRDSGVSKMGVGEIYLFVRSVVELFLRL